jgi:hypothetical protein
MQYLLLSSFAVNENQLVLVEMALLRKTCNTMVELAFSYF